jgi:hypothetical protein
MELPAGQKTADDVVKKAEYLESGMHLPPGSVSISGSDDDAAEAELIITDPRVMKKPIPWPGPSAPGGSIALPLRLGVSPGQRDRSAPDPGPPHERQRHDRFGQVHRRVLELPRRDHHPL